MGETRQAWESQTAWQEVAGYLNFSTGGEDPKFLQNLNLLYHAGQPYPADACPAWRYFLGHLRQQLFELNQHNPAFADIQQAIEITELVGGQLLPAYCAFHRDLLYHQADDALFNPFFIGRAFQAVVQQGGPWTDAERIVEGSLAELNDFIGHRPVAALETDQKIEPYPHERVRPVPLYIARAGVVFGKYHDLIEKTLDILRRTNSAILESASFDLDLLDELAFDPREYDFNHPVNRRPNYHFGQWDPHHIDNKGRYRRFVLVQVTLDAILERIENAQPELRDERLFEGAAVLAGTMLMAAGTSGSGPDSHDSGVTLGNLLPRVAAYRDAFYEQLLKHSSGPHASRLHQEAAELRQPFAGARQNLNLALARHRALQLQNVNLALVYARIGYPAAAARTIRSVPAASARMTCDIQCRLAETRRAIDRGNLSAAASELCHVVDLIQRAIECGALIDPWNIIGFSGQFSLFPALENSISDARVDEFLDLVEEVFNQYARLWAEAAAIDDAALQETASNDFWEVAIWFDRYAISMVSNVKRVFGLESHLAAQYAAGALNAWHKAGTASGDIAFWRPHAEQFDSWRAYSAVLTALLEKDDYTAALGLLVHWAGQAARVHFGEGDRGFSQLAQRWLQCLLASAVELRQQQTLIRRFFAQLEANAEEFWRVPRLGLGEFNLLIERDRPSEDFEDSEEELDALFAEEDEDEEDEEDEIYSAAYDDVVYRDSTDDGVEGPILGDGERATDYELEQEAKRLDESLEFLSAIARLWKAAAPAFAPPREAVSGALSAAAQPLDTAVQMETLTGWRDQALSNRRELLQLLKQVQDEPLVGETSSDSLIEYDRRRVVKEGLLEKIIAACVATADAIRWIQGTLYAVQAGEAAKNVERAAEKPEESASAEVIALWSALVAGQIDLIRERWPQALSAMRRLPLLYIPLAKGGDPQKIVAARSLQHAVADLLWRLPRLGLLREACQLIAAARVMEQDHPVGAGAVSEFDRLFDRGYKALVESLVEAARDEQPPPPALDAETPDEVLIAHLQQLTESLVAQWLAHSRTLRLSALERVAADKDWKALRMFIEAYGHEVFTQHFLNIGNLRAILHQGVDCWLKKAQEDPSQADWKLFQELGGRLPRAEAVQHLSLVIEAVIENYGEYLDYNTTTTHSDRGEMIYTLLDLLRLKAGYERVNWNLKPLVMAHEVLVRDGRAAAAELWRRAIVERTAETADQHQQRIQQLQKKHSLRLITLSDRIAERFIRPLLIDHLRALVLPAVKESRQGLTPVAFPVLELEAGDLASESNGAGLDVPDWIIALEEETAAALSIVEGGAQPEDDFSPGWVRLRWEEIQNQLANWETLTLPGE
ncbi:MAG TPA: hypothetical protein VFE24_09985 [Pirellulales bacterium]|nr:hypothetical protein [Pirellulales bacterium]